MTSIPDELVAAIVDELQHDRDSLKSCATVSSSFCPPSQRHLFRSMWLHRENWKHYTPTQRALQAGNSVPSGTIKGAYNLLAESPHLVAFVRDLTVDLPDSADEDGPLEYILRNTANLERFVVFGLAARWTEIPPVLESALLNVFARPSLNGLHFLHLHGIPTAVIHRVLSSLRVLSFHNTSAAHEDDDETASQAPPPASVEELILSRNMSTTHLRIVSTNASSLANLRRLFLWSGVDTFANRLLMMAAETLEHIEIDCGALETPLNLPALTSVKILKSLKLHISCGLSRWLPPGFARTMEDLGSIQPPSMHLVLSVQDGIASDEWILEGPIFHDDGESFKTTTIHCQLAFLDLPHKGSNRNGLFESFCAGMRMALSGVELKFEKLDRRVSYVGRLPV